MMRLFLSRPIVSASRTRMDFVFMVRQVVLGAFDVLILRKGNQSIFGCGTNQLGVTQYSFVIFFPPFPAFIFRVKHCIRQKCRLLAIPPNAAITISGDKFHPIRHNKFFSSIYHRLVNRHINNFHILKYPLCSKADVSMMRLFSPRLVVSMSR